MREAVSAEMCSNTSRHWKRVHSGACSRVLEIAQRDAKSCAKCAAPLLASEHVLPCGHAHKACADHLDQYKKCPLLWAEISNAAHGIAVDLPRQGDDLVLPNPEDCTVREFASSLPRIFENKFRNFLTR